MGLRHIFGFCVALFPVAVLAQSVVVAPPVSPTEFLSGSKTKSSTGLESSTTQTLRLPDGGQFDVDRSAEVTFTGMAQSTADRLNRNPNLILNLPALKYTAEKEGWDYRDGKYYDLETAGEPVDPVTPGFWAGGNPLWSISNTAMGACTNGEYHPHVPGHFELEMINPFQYWCWYYYADGGRLSVGAVNWAGSTSNPIECPPDSTYDEPLGGCYIDGYVAIPIPQILDDVETSIPEFTIPQLEEIVADMFRHQPDSVPGFQELSISGPASLDGTTSLNTQPDPAGDIATETSTSYSMQYGQPNSVGVTRITSSKVYQGGVQIGESETVESPGNATAPGGVGDEVVVTKMPALCTWAGPLCDWIDSWGDTSGLGDPDLTGLIVDEDFERSKNFSFGSGSCPADITLNIALVSQPVTITMQWMCDLAAIARYFIMISAYIFAAFTIIGVSRSN